MIATYLRAAHFPPTVAVSVVITACAWSLGWRGAGLLGIAAAVVVGQLSVGWSNDAFDADLDAAAGRAEKPTVAGDVTAAALWRAAVVALATSVVLSIAVAGVVGGGFHVLALVMAWLYNTVLSRTAWSWLPYAVAFGSLPPFLTYGLDGSPPPTWMLVVFPIVGVSAHLANALPDIESDRSIGLDGAAIRLGQRRSAAIGWVLLAIGSAVLAVEAARDNRVLSVVVVLGYLAAAGYASMSSRRTAMFHALLLAVVLDVVVLVLVAR